MSDKIEVRVPDIGDFTDVEVIEVHVGAGDNVSLEDPLVTLETDKASMDVPSTAAGRVLAGRSKGRGKVLIGKDTRISGYMFESALEAGLSAAGIDILLACAAVTTGAIFALARITWTALPCARSALCPASSTSANPIFMPGA